MVVSLFEDTFLEDYNMSFNNDIKCATHVFNIVVKEILKSFSDTDENSMCKFFIYF